MIYLDFSKTWPKYINPLNITRNTKKVNFQSKNIMNPTGKFINHLNCIREFF